MARDLTEGRPMKVIVSFTLPLIFGFLFQQFYSLMDALIVGRFLGTRALASVGTTGSLNFLVLGFLMGVCSGFTIPVAQCFGARDGENLRRFVTNGALLCALVSAVMMAATLGPLRLILTAMRTPDDIFEGARAYIGVIFWGIPLTALYNFLSGVIRAMGDSRTPVIYLTVASAVNIALDILLITRFQMGVAGAAVATVISQGMAGLLCALRVYRMKELRFTRDDWRADGARMRRLWSLGVPMGLQFSITAVGSLVLQASVNAIGSAAVASVTAASKLSMFFACVYDALGSAAATFAGQNTGAGKVERIPAGLRAESVLGLGYSVIALAVVALFGRNLLGLFIGAGEASVIEDAYRYLFINACFYVPLLFVNILRLTIQGTGHTAAAIFAGVFEMAARTLVGVAFVPVFGFTAACFASPAAWVLADVYLFAATARVLRHLNMEQVARARAKAMTEANA